MMVNFVWNNVWLGFIHQRTSTCKTQGSPLEHCNVATISVISVVLMLWLIRVYVMSVHTHRFQSTSSLSVSLGLFLLRQPLSTWPFHFIHDLHLLSLSEPPFHLSRVPLGEVLTVSFKMSDDNKVLCPFWDLSWGFKLKHMRGCNKWMMTEMMKRMERTCFLFPHWVHQQSFSKSQH